jgi:tetratricopeptide (TPR) repeat protein
MISRGGCISAVVAVLAILLVASTARAQESVQDALDRAAKLYEAGNYRAARDAYEEATKLDLGSIPAWRGLGWSEWSLGRHDRAIQIWNDALRVKPNDAGIVLALAIAAEQRGRIGEAIALYGKVLDIERDNLGARLGRARMFTMQERWREAEVDLRAVLDRQPNQIEAQFALAQVYRATDRQELAREMFERLARQPAEPKHYRALADAMLETGKAEQAADLYRRNLRHQPGNRGTMLGLARAYTQLHRYRDAIATLEQFVAANPDDAKMREELARTAYYAGEYEIAADHLQALVDEHPEETKWKMSLARAFEQLERPEEAEELAREILRQDPEDDEAHELLYEHVRTTGDVEATIVALERLLAVEPTARRWNDLGDFHLIRAETLKKAGATEDASQAYLRSVDAHQKASMLDPTNHDAKLGMATALRLRGDYQQAIDLAQSVTREFPNVERARRELYESHAGLGQYDRAAAHLRAVMELFPNNPRLELEFARIQFRSGEKQAAIQSLHRMLEQPIADAVPILLYHGVSPAATRAETMPLANFRDQMRALREEGYHSITIHQLVAFLEKGAPLPENPIFITFDDGRDDSFRYADPVLEEFGFRATMFVPVADIGSHGPFNAVWDTVRAMKANGRWDMQCHSFAGHHQIPVDAEGTTGLFLANRKWLESEKRLETTAEYRRRLEEDYRQCGEVLKQNVPGTKLVGYAFPFGELGQKGFTNEPSSVVTNEKLAVQYYDYGFVQDAFGYATRRSSRATLPRFEVPRQFTGADLVAQLQATEPYVATSITLGDLYSWDGQFAAANEIFDRLAEREGVDRTQILARRGRIDLWRGDFAAARAALAEVAAKDPSNTQALAGLESLQLRTRPQLEMIGLLFDDNGGRTNFGIGPRGSLYLSDRLIVSAAYRFRNLTHDRFDSQGVDGFGEIDPAGGDPLFPGDVDLDVQGHEFEGQADYRWDWRTGIILSGGVAQFQDESSDRFRGGGDPDPVPLASLEARFPLGALVDARLSVEQGYVGTAGAVLDETGETSGRARVRFRPWEPTELNGDFRGARYDGGNSRRTAMMQALQRVWNGPAEVHVGYQFRYDDADEFDPFFWTPDTYVGNDGVLKLSMAPNDVVTIGLTTTVGTGRERGGDQEFQASVLGDGSIQVANRFGLFMNGGRSQAADYESLSLSGGFYLTF